MTYIKRSNQNAFATIQRYNGRVLGAVLWIPVHVFEKFIEPEQGEITVSFVGNCIFIGKEEKPTIQAGQNNVLFANSQENGGIMTRQTPLTMDDKTELDDLKNDFFHDCFGSHSKTSTVCPFCTLGLECERSASNNSLASRGAI